MNFPTMTLEEFRELPPETVMRVVTTKYHLNTEFGNPELTFVVVKGMGQDWAIYYHFADKGVAHAASQGEKLTTESRIRAIFPCDDLLFSCYRM